VEVKIQGLYATDLDVEEQVGLSPDGREIGPSYTEDWVCHRTVLSTVMRKTAKPKLQLNYVLLVRGQLQ